MEDSLTVGATGCLTVAVPLQTLVTYFIGKHILKPMVSGFEIFRSQQP